MMMSGRVVGGDYLDATVTPAPFGSDLVVQAGLRRRKLNAEHVAEWDEVLSASGGKISAVGQAVAGAVLPQFVSKPAAAAVGAALDNSTRPPHTVRVVWTDGKQSLVKLPDKLFLHLELVLRDKRAAAPAAPVIDTPTDVAPVAQNPPTVAEQAFSLVTGLLKDRSTTSGDEPVSATAPDVTEQLLKLASLRDAGVLTDEEFTAKKTELLSRM